jgi:hypothetical protein
MIDVSEHTDDCRPDILRAVIDAATFAEARMLTHDATLSDIVAAYGANREPAHLFEACGLAIWWLAAQAEHDCGHSVADTIDCLIEECAGTLTELEQ